jgi:tRNA threonylcarbamoyladenosine biosynthesis protein TsaE
VENSPIDIPAVFTTASGTETMALGERLACLLERGGVVALNGALGAGKTCFAKGIAKGLGVMEEVTSPSYTLVAEYEIPEKGTESGGSVLLYHIDAYRLTGNDDFSAIGGEEIINGDGISIIEWSDRIPFFISNRALRVDFEIRGENERYIRIYRSP